MFLLTDNSILELNPATLSLTLCKELLYTVDHAQNLYTKRVQCQAWLDTWSTLYILVNVCVLTGRKGLVSLQGTDTKRDQE